MVAFVQLYAVVGAYRCCLSPQPWLHYSKEHFPFLSFHSICSARVIISSISAHLEPKGAFHLSELAGRTIARPVSLTMKSAFQENLLKNHLLPAHYLGFAWSGGIVLIKNEILITRARVWPVSSQNRSALSNLMTYMPFCIIAIAHSLWTLCEHGNIWQPLNASCK